MSKRYVVRAAAAALLFAVCLAPVHAGEPPFRVSGDGRVLNYASLDPLDFESDLILRRVLSRRFPTLNAVLGSHGGRFEEALSSGAFMPRRRDIILFNSCNGGRTIAGVVRGAELARRTGNVVIAFKHSIGNSLFQDGDVLRGALYGGQPGNSSDKIRFRDWVVVAFKPIAELDERGQPVIDPATGRPRYRVREIPVNPYKMFRDVPVALDLVPDPQARNGTRVVAGRPDPRTPWKPTLDFGESWQRGEALGGYGSLAALGLGGTFDGLARTQRRDGSQYFAPIETAAGSYVALYGAAGVCSEGSLIAGSLGATAAAETLSGSAGAFAQAAPPVAIALAVGTAVYVGVEAIEEENRRLDELYPSRIERTICRSLLIQACHTDGVRENPDILATAQAQAVRDFRNARRRARAGVVENSNELPNGTIFRNREGVETVHTFDDLRQSHCVGKKSDEELARELTARDDRGRVGCFRCHDGGGSHRPVYLSPRGLQR